MPNSVKELDATLLNKLIQPGGVLSKTFKGFESREAQQLMLADIVKAYNEGKIALIEAGTGTGKSLAYLIPALLWAINNGEATVISTHTISLQEQLINKDIPLLAKQLNLPIKAVLVKGMSNYICLRKIKEIHMELNFASERESQEIQTIQDWTEKTPDGTRSSLPLVPSAAVWEQVCAESDTCNNVKCTFYKNCFFFKARQEAANAHLMVANHALLFADLASRSESNNYNNPAILPPYRRIILDEAHHIEDIATEHFAAKISRLGLLRIMARLSSERQMTAEKRQEHGKIALLKKKIDEFYGKGGSDKVLSIKQRFINDLQGHRSDVLIEIGRTFDAFEHFMHRFDSAETQDNTTTSTGSPIKGSKLRLLEEHLTHPDWKQEIQEKSKLLQSSIDKYAVALSSIDKDIDALNDDKLNEATRSLRFDILAFANKLQLASLTLQNFISSTNNQERVRWIESQAFKMQSNVHIINADLDVSQLLLDRLFKCFPTIVLCSATLTTNRHFNYVKERLGLIEKRLEGRIIIENVFESPFNYKEQALLSVPIDAPNPSDPHFIHSVIENTWGALQASRGNAFVLFTSYQMLEKVYEGLAIRLKGERYNPLKQGDDNRQSLLEKFKTTNRSVLFGTDSFWEGVDVAGEALRCVIIVKLPFQVPSEPLVQARTEAIISRGGEPFMEYSIPNAIVKFKQGFGRLIRNRKDRGCIVCLDPRLVKKKYGKLFLNSLPTCQLSFKKGEELQQEMEQFYRNTYKLTKDNWKEEVALYHSGK